jgi:hypothetical protein
MANTNPPESYPISVRVPNQATSSGGTPLNQPIDVNMTPVRMPTAATPLRPVDGGGAGRQAPSNVRTPSGSTSGYPQGFNPPAPSPDGMPKRGRP